MKTPVMFLFTVFCLMSCQSLPLTEAASGLTPAAAASAPSAASAASTPAAISTAPSETPAALAAGPASASTETASAGTAASETVALEASALEASALEASALEASALKAGAETCSAADSGCEDALGLDLFDEEDEELCAEDEDAETLYEEKTALQRPKKDADQSLSLKGLWSGEWTNEKNLVNRADLVCFLPFHGLALRAQALDKRPSPPWTEESLEKAFTSVGGGLYHTPTGSRLFYGLTRQYNLPSRVNGVWRHTTALAEARAITPPDLRVTPSAKILPTANLFLASPALALEKARYTATAQVSAEDVPRPQVSASITRAGEKTTATIEGFFTHAILPERPASAWFSEKYRLPERDFTLFAGSASFSSPLFSLAGDFAASEVFAWGRDYYANAALSFHQKPFTAQFTVEGSGERFTQSDGTVPGAGSRGAARFAYTKTPLNLTLATSVRAPAVQEAPNRSSTDIGARYTGFKKHKIPLEGVRLSLGADRDARSLDKVNDSFDATLGASTKIVKAVPFSAAFKAVVKARALSGCLSNPYPCFWDPHEFTSLRLAGEAAASWKAFRFKAGLGHTEKMTKQTKNGAPERTGEWDGSAQVSFQGKFGAVSVKAENSGGKWSGTLKWKLQAEIP